MRGLCRRGGIVLACLLSACSATSPDGGPSAAIDPGGGGDLAAASNPSSPAAEQLVGMSAEEITRLLGYPHHRRREAPAQVWQYASARCVIFVFLYEGEPAPSGPAQRPSASRDWRVQYIEALSRSDSKPMPTAECLSGLIGRRPSALGEG